MERPSRTPYGAVSAAPCCNPRNAIRRRTSQYDATDIPKSRVIPTFLGYAKCLSFRSTRVSWPACFNAIFSSLRPHQMNDSSSPLNVRLIDERVQSRPERVAPPLFETSRVTACRTDTSLARTRKCVCVYVWADLYGELIGSSKGCPRWLLTFYRRWASLTYPFDPSVMMDSAELYLDRLYTVYMYEPYICTHAHTAILPSRVRTPR